jgi:hypothetical protein
MAGESSRGASCWHAEGDLGTPQDTPNGKRPLAFDSPETTGEGKRSRALPEFQEVVLGTLRLEVVGRLDSPLPREVVGQRCAWVWEEDEDEEQLPQDAHYGVIHIEAPAPDQISIEAVDCDAASKLVRELEGQGEVRQTVYIRSHLTRFLLRHELCRAV